MASLLNESAEAIKKYQQLESETHISSKIDLEQIKTDWKNIVLPNEIEEHILRSLILFAYGDPSAPRGLLLKGPPGTGKSIVAQAFAKSSGANFYNLSVADIKGEHIGQSGNNVLRLWNEARGNQPAIIFIDECEGIFVKRGSDQGDSFTRASALAPHNPG